MSKNNLIISSANLSWVSGRKTLTKRTRSFVKLRTSTIISSVAYQTFRRGVRGMFRNQSSRSPPNLLNRLLYNLRGWSSLQSDFQRKYTIHTHIVILWSLPLHFKQVLRSLQLIIPPPLVFQSLTTLIILIIPKITSIIIIAIPFLQFPLIPSYCIRLFLPYRHNH